MRWAARPHHSASVPPVPSAPRRRGDPDPGRPVPRTQRHECGPDVATTAWMRIGCISLGVSAAGARAAAGPAARIPSPPATPAPAAPPATRIQPGSPARNRRDVTTRRSW